MAAAEEHYVTVDGRTIHYLAAGDGPPLVLVHGGGMDTAALSWSDSIPVFAQTHRVIAPDLPGSGQSDKSHHD